MRILFLSVTAGQGHNRTAQGIMQRMLDAGHSCKLVDTFDYISPLFGEAVDEGYRYSIAHTPKAYGRLFNMLEKAEKQTTLTNRIYKRLGRFLSQELIDMYIQFRPDIVVSSHSCAAQLASSIHEQRVYRCPRIGILTDYTLHPFWQGASMDALVTPSEQLNYTMTASGIPNEILRPLGIPVSPVFAKSMGKQEARELLGVADIPTILVMGGSMGFGDVGKTIESLCHIPQRFQMLVVCGNNARLKGKVERLAVNKPLHVYGFTDQVHVMMSAADMLVTKPGGLTVSEAIVKLLPMVLVNPIPGQEERNMDFLVNHGMAMRVDKHCPVDVVVSQALNPQRQAIIRQAQQAFGKPNATRDLQGLIESFDRKR